MKHVLIALTIALLAAACNSAPGDPRTDHQPAPPPSLAEVFANELADATPRVVGADFDLRYGRPGVLLTSTPDSTFSLINLDNGSRAEYHPADSLLKINAQAIPITRRHLLKTQAHTTWLALTTPADTILVVLTR